MNKVRRIKTLAYFAVAVVVLLQAIWATSVFRATERQLAAQVDEIFKISVNRELMIRSKDVVASLSANTELGTLEDDYETGIIGNFELILQEFSFESGHPISLHMVDTIFTNESAKIDFHYRHIVNRINTVTGEVLETTDTVRQGILPGALASQIILIRMDGSEGVQVLIISPNRAVLIQMILILTLSLLLLIFITYAVFFLLRSFVKEKQLRQMQVEFSNALIHDMKTPLVAMANVNEMLKYEKVLTDIDKRHQLLDISQKQITNLQALTDRILTIARSEESKLVPIWEDVDVTAIINQLIEKFSVQTEKITHFNTQFVPEKIDFVADHTLLNNAISNLIDNAIKYSGESVQIDIDCQLDEMGLFIKIKDNGYGISKKDQNVIFAKFERGAAVSRREAKGFGLGLAYVKSVAEALGGTVDLFSIKGEGATVGLFIPDKDKIRSNHLNNTTSYD
jgi:two-component system phosphate regulon sensor histidine kinase PhoR